MRVFVTGATGFVGSAVVAALITVGHQVLGLARSDAAAAAVAAAGAVVHRGSLEDPESVARGAAACDGVIHTAFDHAFVDFAAAGAADLRVVEAIGTALAGSGRPFVNTTGIAHLPQHRLGTEADAADPNTPSTHRIASEEAGLAFASRGVRATVVRLAPTVHGAGDHGFVPRLIEIARRTGVSAYIGEGLTRWSAVHRLDAARLYRLALERGTAGSRYHGVAEETVPTREIAACIGRGLNAPVVSLPPEEGTAHFGFLAVFFGANCAASSALTREHLGWEPAHPELIADLEQPLYYALPSGLASTTT